MTNLKCIRSALGFVLAFFASTGVCLYLFRGWMFCLQTIFQLVEQGCLPVSNRSPLNNHGLTINHRRENNWALWEEQSEMQ